MDGNNDKKIAELTGNFKSALYELLEFSLTLTDEEVEELGVELDAVLMDAQRFVESISNDEGPFNQ